MIGLSELRASAWKYACIAASVLAVAGLIAALLFWGRLGHAAARADAAEQRAKTAEGELHAVRQAQVRDALAETATQIAIGRMDDQAATTNERLTQLERLLHGRPPVPAVCPDPDPQLVRELGEGSNRFRAAGSELRGLRNAEGAATH